MTLISVQWRFSTLALLAMLMILPGCGVDNVFDGGDTEGKPAARTYTGPRNRTARGANVRCFESFGKFKRTMAREGRSSTGDGNHWHHIVGQHANNKKNFGEYDLHCTDNLTYLDGKDHGRVNGYYTENGMILGENPYVIGSNPRISMSSTSTVRKSWRN